MTAKFSTFSGGAMSLREAIAFTGLRRTTLYRLIESGELVSVKIRNRRLIPKRALIDLLRANADSVEVTAHAE